MLITSVWLSHTYVLYMCALNLRSQKRLLEGRLIRGQATGDRDGSEQPCGFWEMNLALASALNHGGLSLAPISFIL